MSDLNLRAMNRLLAICAMGTGLLIACQAVLGCIGLGQIGWTLTYEMLGALYGLVGILIGGFGIWAYADQSRTR